MKGAGDRGLPTPRQTGENDRAVASDDCAGMQKKNTALMEERPKYRAEQKKPYRIEIGAGYRFYEYLAAVRNQIPGDAVNTQKKLPGSDLVEDTLCNRALQMVWNLPQTNIYIRLADTR